MRYLFTGDWHLTDRRVDEYRWDIIEWVQKQVDRRGVDALFILGDLTHAKDHHSAELVNRLVSGLLRLKDLAPVYIVRGNHDYGESGHTFFEFLRFMGFTVATTEPVRFKFKGDRFLLLPHVPKGHSQHERVPLDEFDFVLMHQTVTGAVSESGTSMMTVSNRRYEDCPGLVISGDVHVPQRVGKVWYVGAPHPVNFGDDFDPRVLLVEDGEVQSIKRVTIKKLQVVVRHLDELDSVSATEGDQVRVKLELDRSEFGLWRKHRKTVVSWAKSRQLVLCGVELGSVERDIIGRVRLRARAGGDQRTILDRYCEAREVEDPLRRTGRRLLS